MCGFVGVIGPERAAPEIVMALQALQHRGQDAAGVGTYDGERFHLEKNLGLVTQALPERTVQAMKGHVGVGHVRYPTVGGGDKGDAQPFLTRRPGILMAHNGNVTNLKELESSLLEKGIHVLSRCDVEPILMALADELGELKGPGPTFDQLATACGRVMDRVRGGYSVVATMLVDGEASLVAFRDAHGIRPLVMGKRDDGAWMVASESVALDLLDYKDMRYLAAGSVAVLRAGREPVVREVRREESRPCVFERIYFARADAVVEEGRVNQIRWDLGTRLADEWKAKGLEADVTVAVPDTSRPAAMAMAERLGIVNREGFIKNRYSGRTFIMPHQAMRDAALRLKLNPIREVFEGKRVIVVDDSIVRGTTMRRIVRLVREMDPASIHVAIFSPPVRNPCFYGIDMPSHAELVAARRQESLEDDLATMFGADTVTFLSNEGMHAVLGTTMCGACFDGDYVVPVSDNERAIILDDRRSA